MVKHLNINNLFSFADKLPDNYLVISARAPIVLGTNSFAWYQVDFSVGKTKGEAVFQSQIVHYLFLIFEIRLGVTC